MDVMGRAVEFLDAVNKKISISNGKKITVIGETCSHYERKFDGDKVKRLKAQTSEKFPDFRLHYPKLDTPLVRTGAAYASFSGSLAYS